MWIKQCLFVNMKNLYTNKNKWLFDNIKEYFLWKWNTDRKYIKIVIFRSKLPIILYFC